MVNDDFTQEADVYIENGIIQQVGLVTVHRELSEPPHAINIMYNPLYTYITHMPYYLQYLHFQLSWSSTYQTVSVSVVMSGLGC